MAVVVNFHGGSNPASVSGKTINNFAGSPSNIITAGTLSSDLLDYDSGSGTGYSFEMDEDKIENTNGRAEPDPGDELTREVNTEGAYNDGGSSGTTYTDTYTVSSTVTSVDVELYRCTTFSTQTDIDHDVNGSTDTAFDSTNNTSGDTVVFTGIVPDVNDQIVIQTTNNTGQFTFDNGSRLYNITESGGATSLIFRPSPLKTHLAR